MSIWKPLSESKNIGNDEPVLIKLRYIDDNEFTVETARIYKQYDGKLGYALFDGDSLDGNVVQTVGVTDDYPTEFNPISELNEDSPKKVLLKIKVADEAHCESANVIFYEDEDTGEKTPTFCDTSNNDLRDVFSVPIDILGWTHIPE